MLQLLETILQHSATPPCSIINDANDIIYIHGSTGNFLEPAEGKASVNIVKTARPGLKAELSIAIRQVAKHKQEVTRRGFRVKRDGGHVYLNLMVRPILEQTAMHGLMMVVFEEAETPEKEVGRKPRRPSSQRMTKTGEELEQELQYTSTAPCQTSSMVW